MRQRTQRSALRFVALSTYRPHFVRLVTEKDGRGWFGDSSLRLTFSFLLFFLFQVYLLNAREGRRPDPPPTVKP